MERETEKSMGKLLFWIALLKEIVHLHGYRIVPLPLLFQEPFCVPHFHMNNILLWFPGQLWIWSFSGREGNHNTPVEYAIILRGSGWIDGSMHCNRRNYNMGDILKHILTFKNIAHNFSIFTRYLLPWRIWWHGYDYAVFHPECDIFIFFLILE